MQEDSQAAEQQDALAGQATAGEAGLPEGWDSDQFQQPFTPAEPDAVTNAPTFGGSPFDPAALYGAADALRAGQYGEPEQPSALDQTLVRPLERTLYPFLCPVHPTCRPWLYACINNDSLRSSLPLLSLSLPLSPL